MRLQPELSSPTNFRIKVWVLWALQRSPDEVWNSLCPVLDYHLSNVGVEKCKIQTWNVSWMHGYHPCFIYILWDKILIWTNNVLPSSFCRKAPLLFHLDKISTNMTAPTGSIWTSMRKCCLKHCIIKCVVNILRNNRESQTLANRAQHFC